MNHVPNRALAILCLALSMSLVGVYVALSKPLAVALPIFLLAWLRFGIGAVAMLRWLKKPAIVPAMTRQTKRLVFIESFLGNFLFTLCMIYGVSLTGAVSAGIILSAIPAVAALLSWVLLKERIAPRTWAAIALSAIGIGLLALTQDTAPHALPTLAAGTTQAPAWLGNLLVFCAVVCEAAYTVIGKKLTAVLSPKRISALINLWGLALMTPLGLWTALHFDFSPVKTDIWLLLLFYGMAASVWTVWLWMTGLKTIPAAQAGVFTVMLPLSATLTGVLVLGESLSGGQLWAFGLAVSGMVLATLPQRRRSRPSA
ncbi:DMT family transporter [Herbaspirillum sp. RTI4]|uniref:DMT family transporter n=1 Tax=Herbaspirillum sp. RTI4 TaxID=3048640 RepID=UPI002AB41E18|nr:DMT family transporter [Herbaspirillum sp. RTI4]MDY7577465.1 DMT family transporter [Herbaspirillum sp. RTI4]MEA9981741.1 DMT family transporter [Herbaspirillum sp. RTI4]